MLARLLLAFLFFVRVHSFDPAAPVIDAAGDAAADAADAGGDAADAVGDAVDTAGDAVDAGNDAADAAGDAADVPDGSDDVTKALEDAKAAAEKAADDLKAANEAQDPDAIEKAKAAVDEAKVSLDEAKAAMDSVKQDGSAKKEGCFDGQSTVLTTSGVKRLDELQLGDMVSTRNGFSKVVHWIHRAPTEQISYLKIHLVDGNILTISSLHLLYVGKCSEPIPDDPKFAHRAQRSQCLFTGVESTPSEIVDIKEESSMGLFAPLTENGDIMVNGVHASCYCNVENGKTFLRLIHQFVQLLDSLIEPLKSFGIEFDSFKFVAAGLDFTS